MSKLHKTQPEEQTTGKSKAQLFELFEKKGYSASMIKSATKVSKLTAQLYTELHAACSRITLHPDTTDFISGEWSALRKGFKDSFGHVLPETEPGNSQD